MRTASLLIFLLLTACSETTGEKYARYTEGKSHADWRNTYVWQRVGAGFALNAIPGFHLGGLIIDTTYVYTGLDDLVLGNGAIIERQQGCDGLVSEDDYQLFFAWQGGQQNLVMSTFRKLYEAKKDAVELSDQTAARALQRGQTLRSITPAARQVIEKKVTEKLTAKIGSKLVAKAIGKAVAGFIPILGPIVASFVNYLILNDIDRDSKEYFHDKADIFCAQGTG